MELMCWLRDYSLFAESNEVLDSLKLLVNHNNWDYYVDEVLLEEIDYEEQESYEHRAIDIKCLFPNYNYYGHGCSRVVIGKNDLIFKLPLTGTEIDCNRKELDLYHFVNQNKVPNGQMLLKPLGHVIDKVGTVVCIVYKRCCKVEFIDNVYEKEINDFINGLESHDVYLADVSRECNLGLLHGNLKIIDYAEY